MDHELKVGDLIYSNGALASVDDNAPVSDDCVGVVYFVGNPMPSVLYPFTEDNEFTYSERQDALLRDHRAVPMDWFGAEREYQYCFWGER